MSFCDKRPLTRCRHAIQRRDMRTCNSQGAEPKAILHHIAENDHFMFELNMAGEVVYYGIERGLRNCDPDEIARLKGPVVRNPDADFEAVGQAPRNLKRSAFKRTQTLEQCRHPGEK